MNTGVFTVVSSEREYHGKYHGVKVHFSGQKRNGQGDAGRDGSDRRLFLWGAGAANEQSAFQDDLAGGALGIGDAL